MWLYIYNHDRLPYMIVIYTYEMQFLTSMKKQEQLILYVWVLKIHPVTTGCPKTNLTSSCHIDFKPP